MRDLREINENQNKRKITDVFLSTKNKVLTFQKKVLTIEVDLDGLKKNLSGYRIMAGYLILFLVFISILVFSFKSKADVANFYPQNCLGSWENPKNAEGIPEVKNNSNKNDFFPDNSTVLNNTTGQLFCGKFTGEVPQDTFPKRFVLRFSILASDNLLPNREPFPLENEIVPDNIIDALEVPPTNETPETTLPEENILPTEENIQTETTPPVDSTSTPDTTTTELTSTPETSPVEPTPTPTPTPTSEPVPENVTPPVEDNSSVSFLQKNILTIAYAQEQTTPTPEETETTPEKVETESSNNYLEVSYTLDGSEWKSLGYINGENINDPFFEIPLNNLSYEDISKIQISITPVTSIDKNKIFYLDAMWVEVEYEKATDSLKALPKVSIKDDSSIEAIDGATEFSGDEIPTFNINDPDLSNYKIAQLVENKKAEVIEDKDRVLDNALGIQNKIEDKSTSSTEGGFLQNIQNKIEEQITNIIAPTEEPVVPTTTENEPLIMPSVEQTPSSLDLILPTIENLPVPGDNTALPTESNEINNPSPEPTPENLNNVPDTNTSATDSGDTNPVTSFLFNNFFVKKAQAAFSGAKVTEAKVFDVNGSETSISTTVETIEVDGKEIEQVKIIKPSREFKPGKYTLRITLMTDTAIIETNQDFTWGVLVVNTDKSIYAPGDNAYLQMGVIDDHGHTICAASLEMEITTPSGFVQHFSTEREGVSVEGENLPVQVDLGSLIVKDSECGPDNVVLSGVPDYHTNFTNTTEVGEYKIKLTANTENGVKTIFDKFKVDGGALFDVRRVTASRIQPRANYPVSIYITAKNNFSGKIIERVPTSFNILSPKKSIPFDTVEEIAGEKMITWNLELKAGEEKILGYYYDAPNISPELFLLGPLEFYDTSSEINFTEPIFKEIRKWQIASDATKGPYGPKTMANDTGTGSVAWDTPDNASESDDNYSSVELGEASVSNYLKATQFGFDIPDGATIGGILVEIERSANSTDVAYDNEIKIVKSDGTIGSTNRSVGAAWPVTDTYASFGGSSDLWGETWSSTDINDSDFGVVVSVEGEKATANVDYIRITVTYTTASTISISGTADGNNGGTVKVAVNGTIQAQTATIGSSAWSISSVTAPTANDIITVFVDGVTDANETTGVTKYSSSNITGMVLNTGVLTIGSNQNTSVSVSNLSQYMSSNDEDVMHSVGGGDPSTLSVQGSGNTYTNPKLSILASNTLTVASGETVATGLINNAGTITSTDNALYTLNGTSGTIFTNTGTFTQATSTVTFSGNGDVTLTSNNSFTFYNLTLSPTLKDNNRAYSFGTSALTINGNFNINPTDSSGTHSLTVNLGADTTVASSKTTTITRTTSATSTLDTRPSSTDYDFSTGAINIAAGGTLDCGSSASIITLTGYSGVGIPGNVLFAKAGTFTQGTSEVVVTAATGLSTLLSADTTFHKLTINSDMTVINAGAVITMSNADAGNKLYVQKGVLNDGGNTIVGTSNGTLEVAAGQTLCISGTATGTNATCDSGATPTTASTFPTNYTNGNITLAATSTIYYNADAATTVSATPTYGNLYLKPTLTAGRTYTLGGALTINGNFTISPNKTTTTSYALTVNAGGHITVAATGTTLITKTGSYATSSLDLRPSVSSYNLDTGYLNIATGGTLDCASATLTITLKGTGSTALFTRVGTFTITSSNTTVVMNPDANVTLTSGTITFKTLNLTPTITAARTYTFGSGAITADIAFTINPTASSAYALTVNMGANITVSGQTSITGTTNATSVLDTRPASTNRDLSTASLIIYSHGTLDCTSAASNITLTGTSGTLFTNAGTFTPGTSTVIMNGNGAPTLTSGNITFYTLTLSPTITAARTYTFGSGAIIINGNFNINPTASSSYALTVNMGADITVSSAGTTTITRTTSATSVLDTRPASTDYNLSTGLLDIATGGTLDCASAASNITLSATSGTLITEAGTFTPGSSTVILSGNGTATVNADTITFYNLTSSGTGTKSLGAAIVINNNLNNSNASGVLDTVSGQNYGITVGGNWTNSGTFTARSGLVTLNSGTTATITGATTFYDLTITHASAKEVNFSNTAGHIINVTHTFTVTGHAGELIKLYSASTGNKWHFNPTGTATVAYADVKDGGCEATAITITPTNTIDSGNNESCWNLLKTLTFTLSDNDIFFGILRPSGNSCWAQDSDPGQVACPATTETTAHTFTAETNSPSGYSITVSGGTLTSANTGNPTISAIGGTPDTPHIGTEQFGIRFDASGGSGTVSAPYSTAGQYAFNLTQPSQVASSTSASTTTTYSAKYMCNISPQTEAGTYTTTLTYVITGNF